MFVIGVAVVFLLLSNLVDQITNGQANKLTGAIPFAAIGLGVRGWWEGTRGFRRRRR